MVRELLALFKKDSNVLKQAAALGVPPQKAVVQPKAVAEKAQQRQVPYRQRLTYAEEQAKWEWEHNKAARDAYQRQKDGFL